MLKAHSFATRHHTNKTCPLSSFIAHFKHQRMGSFHIYHMHLITTPRKQNLPTTHTWSLQSLCHPCQWCNQSIHLELSFHVSADLLRADYGFGCLFAADYQQGQQELCQQTKLLKEISYMLPLQYGTLPI